MSDFIRALRIGFRSLRKRPLLLTTATLTLGLGLGAATGVFSVVEAALLQPLPFRGSDRLAVVWGVAGPEQDVRFASPIEIEDWDAGVDALGPLARYDATTVNLSEESGAVQLQAEMVGVSFFSILGVSPVLGRTFAPEDDQAGAAGNAVISHDLWQRRWGGSSDVLGRTLRLDDVEFTIVGVMPAGFRGLSFNAEIWVPLGPFASPELLTSRGNRWLSAVGRLAPGASEALAQQQLTAVAERLAATYPDANRERGALLVSLRDSYVGQSRSLLLMILGGVALLLLIACANVANLQLVRAMERRSEVALRYALGAGRRFIVRQLLAENMVLAAFGAAAAVFLAWAGLRLLLPFIPDGVLPPYAEPGLNGAVLGFTLAIALVSGLLFALIPALGGAAERSGLILRSGLRASSRPGRRFGRPAAQQAIIVAEVAMAMVLLVAAGLAARSLQAQLAIEPGFHADGVLVARVAPSGDGYDGASRVAFAEALLEELTGMAGVKEAAIMSDGPLRGYSSASYIFRAEDPMSAETRIRYYRHSVTPAAFEALGIPILQGRGLTGSDRDDSPRVVVVSRAFAAKVWPAREAVGRRVVVGGDTATVVGVAGDVRYRTLTTDLMDPGEDPDVYFAYAQRPTSSFDILIRSAGDPTGLTGQLRSAVGARDPALPLYDVAPLQTILARQTALGRMVSALLVVFGALALVVAAVGLYGVLAFVVRGRRREIAIRSAIGAEPGRIRGMILAQGLVLTGVGLLVGLLGSVAAGKVAASFLFGIQPADPLVLAATTLALLAVAALASILPAVQATRIAPRSAMMED